MSRNYWLSIGLFSALLVVTWLLSGGRFVFGLFVFPLGLIPLLLGKRKNK